ncbi:MAG: type II toxin-antitoxin system Phd/YefM family antitoxin [Sphingomonadaceae bacterium]|nr:type II toxin-antitoxin system Phd/YefM family antitoxin [Sphingomonadaceae bacterium]
MTTVTIHQAKTHLSRLLAAVEAGQEIVIARGKNEIAKIVPLKPVTKKKRELGWLAHELSSPGKDPLEDGFWDPLPEEDLALWEGENEAKWKDFSSTLTR